MTRQQLRLSLACWNYDRTRALQTGEIRPEGIELIPLTLPVEETFYRMLRYREFDVAELSLSSYVLSLFQAEPPFIAIPVFPSRVFRHGSIYTNSASGITKPGDLRGRPVGVPEYQMTAAVWIRGILEDRHGLPADEVSYRTGGLHEPGRTEKITLDLPGRFDVRPIANDQTLNELLADGRIDALYSARAPRSFDPRQPAAPVRRLFPDPKAIEQEYFRATGIFPIMHTIVIRRDVYEANRWVARSLLDAFTQAKAMMYPELTEIAALKYSLPWGVNEAEETMALMGEDFWPYGIEANRVTLETFLRYSFEQGLARRLLQPADIFAPEAMGQVLV
jgi:4,5-dihydroxyphthalate decarboxylase